MMRCLLALLCLAAASAPASAQTANIQKEVEKTLHQARVYEDIEIMRRLLSRKLTALMQSCQRCHRAGGEMGGGAGDPMLGGAMPPGMIGGIGGQAPAGVMGLGPIGLGVFVGEREAGAAQDSLLFDGVYVPGHGVVLQAQVSGTFFSTVPTAAHAKPAANLSEWETIRKQLRGEKVENTARMLDEHHQLNMPDILIAALAESGKHFASLRDNEKLTVAITFSPGARWEGVGGMGGPAGAGDAFGQGRGSGVIGGAPMVPPGAGHDPMAGAAGPGGSGFGFGGPSPPTGRSTSKDYELLADYHLKQSRYDDAAKSLLKAISLNNDAARDSGLQRKLAIAYLMLDQYQRNDADVVGKALDAIKKAADTKKTYSPPQRTMILPQRLIVSASRQALQQASRDNIEEFRRHASVEWLRFDRPAGPGTTEGAP
jgi:hypothetical protein